MGRPRESSIRNSLRALAVDYSDLRRFLLESTRIVKAVAATSEGEFLFDLRDELVGGMLAAGEWEHGERAQTELFKMIVRPGDLVVDAGANFGWYTVLAAKQAGESVVAFEPDPDNYALLAANLRWHGVFDRVRPYRCALHESEGRLTFEKSGDNFGDHRVRSSDASGVPAYYGETARETLTVEARTLDGVLDGLGLAGAPIRLIKIDTQGAEVAILRGGGRALANARYLLCEYWPYGLRRAGADPDAFFQLVRPHFSHFGRINAATTTLTLRPIGEFPADAAEPGDDMSDTPVSFSNYFFAKPGG